MEKGEKEKISPEELLERWKSLARPMDSKEVQNEREIVIEILKCFPEEILDRLVAIEEDKIVQLLNQYSASYIPKHLQLKAQDCFGNNPFMFQIHLIMILRKLKSLKLQ